MALEETMSRLADIDVGELPFITAYLDLRPEATGGKPELRSGLVVLKDRLREIRKTFLPRGAALDSFEADRERIETYIRLDRSASARAAAIFACSGAGIFEALETGAHFENQVTVAPRPDLYQLARLLDVHETSILALVDSNTARLFVHRLGVLSEKPGLDEDPVHFQKRATGGWSQARYQRHIDKHRRDFAEEVAQHLNALDEEVNAKHILLAGDEVAITPLTKQLARSVAKKVRNVLRIHIRAPRDDVEAIVEPVVRELEAQEAASLVGQLVAEIRRTALGVAGVEETLRALTNAQVDVLFIDDEATVDRRAEFVSQATATGADIEVLHGDEQLLALGGVAALLRYRV
jgi:peptide chain release factor subunit 1